MSTFQAIYDDTLHCLSTTNGAALNRPNHVAHPTIDAVCDVMRGDRRYELVHYAGACHRDDVAWQMVLAWAADRKADEATLKSRALKAAGWGDITPEDLRAAAGKTLARPCDGSCGGHQENLGTGCLAGEPGSDN